MTLTAGSRLGPYEVLALIGAGGMGEVYRATDTNLGRQVAIKILPDAFAHDSERLARFEREAKTLAALNHPNIAIIHGLDKADGIRALVMELVEGPTLADRIAQGPIPVDETLPIAKQIAEALEAAHQQGIIHRDLKPANIKVRPDGTVKVLDFGLAKALESTAISPNLSDSPTITSPAMTQRGVILGTAAYMSPEQARGKTVDKRSDIWAFGCVLYEMLTGKRAFHADNLSDTLAAVLRGNVDWTLLPAHMSPVVRTFLVRCLHKNPKQRIGDVQDIRLALAGEFDAELAPVRVADTPARPLWSRALPISIAVAVGASVTAGLLRSTPSVPNRGVVRSSILLPAVSHVSNGPIVTLSPDGLTLVYAGSDRLYRRELSQLMPQPIPGTEGGSQPFFSPDGQWLGFVDRTGNVKRVSLNGQPPITILSWRPQELMGASWDTNGQILLGRLFGGLYRVSANGGPAVAVTSVGADETHLDPQPIPGTSAALFTIVDVQGQYHVAVVSLDTGMHRRIALGSSPRYLPSGHLVFQRDATLWAGRFDPQQLALMGEPVAVLEDVHFTLGAGHFAMSGANGSLIYARRSDIRTELRWIDRNGLTVEVPGAIDGLLFTFDLSPDGRRLAFSSHRRGGELLVYDADRKVTSQLLGVGGDPKWSPDGRRLAYAEGSMGKLSSIAAEGGVPTVLLQHKNGSVWLGLDDWSPVGDRLAAHVHGPRNRGIVLSPRGNSEPIVFDEADGLDEAEFSPDGKWIAYNANHGAGFEIWVVPFPPKGERVQISSGGGVQPQWRSDGRELFYLSFNGTLMSAPIDTTKGFHAGTPTPLFDTGLVADSNIEQYAVGRDGLRFLVPRPSGAPSLVLIHNWVEELKRLVPTN